MAKDNKATASKVDNKKEKSFISFGITPSDRNKDENKKDDKSESSLEISPAKSNDDKKESQFADFLGGIKEEVDSSQDNPDSEKVVSVAIIIQIADIKKVAEGKIDKVNATKLTTYADGHEVTEEIEVEMSGIEAQIIMDEIAAGRGGEISADDALNLFGAKNNSKSEKMGDEEEEKSNNVKEDSETPNPSVSKATVEKLEKKLEGQISR
jgi:hypothetical protein